MLFEVVGKPQDERFKRQNGGRLSKLAVSPGIGYVVSVSDHERKNYTRKAFACEDRRGPVNGSRGPFVNHGSRLGRSCTSNDAAPSSRGPTLALNRVHETLRLGRLADRIVALPGCGELDCSTNAFDEVIAASLVGKTAFRPRKFEASQNCQQWIVNASIEHCEWVTVADGGASAGASENGIRCAGVAKESCGVFLGEYVPDIPMK